MKAYTQSKENVLKNLNSDIESGLSDVNVAESLRRYGSNTIEKPPPPSLLNRIIMAMREPMLIMLILAGLVALGVNVAMY